MKQIETVKHLIVKITPSLPSQSSRGRAAKLSSTRAEVVPTRRVVAVEVSDEPL
jgi:hypothetical protein